jgi:hypothetical protein
MKDDLLKELEQQNSDFLNSKPDEPTEAEMMDAADEVNAEQQQAINNKPKVIESVDSPKVSEQTEVEISQAQSDVFMENEKARNMPGYKSVFCTEPEQLPQFSRANKFEAYAFATLDLHTEMLSGKRKLPARTIHIRKILQYYQGVDGKSIEDFIVLHQINQTEKDNSSGLVG